MSKATVILLETSDVHGQLFPVHYATNQPSESGLSRIATIIKNERANNEHVIVVDNGDLIQGTPFMYHYVKKHAELPNPMILAANKIGYDAAVFGNHEFNYGQDILRDAIELSDFPWLSATILNEETNEPFFGTPYKIKTLSNGIKVGILGLTTPYIPNWEKEDHIHGMKFISAVEAAKHWVTFLKEEQNVDLIVVSYHGGFERDLHTGEPTENLTGENEGYTICQEIPEIDVLLTGHQHREIENVEINGVLVVQPGSAGTKVGKVTLTLEQKNESWCCVTKTSELVSASSGHPDQEILALTQEYEDKAQAWLDQPIGKIKGNMLVTDPLEVRIRDNALVEFVNKIQMRATHTDISNTAIFNNDVPGFPEDVTMRDVMANYIYPNTLKVIRITGQDIKDALEHSATYFSQYDGESIKVNPDFTTPKPQHYNYDMWEGIEYKLNISKPVGERVVLLNYKGKAIDLNAEYDVVMNNYRAGGGGEYTMYQNKAVVKEIPIDVSELLADYFLEKGTVEAEVNHNWEVIFDA